MKEVRMVGAASAWIDTIAGCKWRFGSTLTEI